MTTARSTVLAALAVVVWSLAFPLPSSATGGRYVFDGGSADARRQVVHALAASDFDWDLVPGVVVIHIARGVSSGASAGHIWLDADLLDAGKFAWGVVQHEYAHQVDFQLFDEPERRGDESSALPPAQFRRLIATLIRRWR